MHGPYPKSLKQEPRSTSANPTPPSGSAFDKPDGMRKEVAADIRAVFNAPSRSEAERLLQMTVDKYGKSAPKLARWVEDNVPEGLTVFALPKSHQRRMRTSNSLERLSREI